MRLEVSLVSFCFAATLTTFIRDPSFWLMLVTFEVLTSASFSSVPGFATVTLYLFEEQDDGFAPRLCEILEWGLESV